MDTGHILHNIIKNNYQTSTTAIHFTNYNHLTNYFLILF